MNWGKSIVLTFVVFAGFIGTMVYKMTRQSVDLVRDDYYQTEMTYQQQIDREINARQKSPVNMTYQADKNQFAIELPATLRKGDIHFYRPSNLKLDFSIPLDASQVGTKVVSTAKLARGRWLVKLNWSDDQREYYTEQELSL
ncbi:FixH family protein [Spirosoma pollinicola]|uniref:Nitrogen fixation protein FixH n=1 Tax=Spirosoma pollinicola TaxID=2057025 RepID=A0A2K8Z309_9BACT|nr:FixH family protein [Spirosoma pollinicola]AUD04266.1 nitrogen fixation protein FixH [Spirosoma pollinicola]